MLSPRQSKHKFFAKYNNMITFEEYMLGLSAFVSWKEKCPWSIQW